MPGVLIMESLAQAAGIWLLHDAPDPSRLEVHVVGIDGAKFRRPVVPGDQLRLEVQVLRRRRGLCRVRGEVTIGRAPGGGGDPAAAGSPTCRHPRSTHGAGGGRRRAGHRACASGPTASWGRRCGLGARTVARVARRDRRRHDDRRATTTCIPFCSVGLEPQDLKFRGEATRLEIGDRNTIREFVTIHRGHGGRRRADAHRLGQPVHGLCPHRPRLPGGEPHHLRQRRHAGRATSR